MGSTPATNTRADPPVGWIRMERVFVQRPLKGQLPTFYVGKAPLHSRVSPGREPLSVRCFGGVWIVG